MDVEQKNRVWERGVHCVRVHVKEKRLDKEKI
jgi:hypothetical protein